MGSAVNGAKLRSVGWFYAPKGLWGSAQGFNPGNHPTKMGRPKWAKAHVKKLRDRSNIVMTQLLFLASPEFECHSLWARFGSRAFRDTPQVEPVLCRSLRYLAVPSARKRTGGEARFILVCLLRPAKFPIFHPRSA